MINDILLGLSFLVFISSLVVIGYLLKSRKFEEEQGLNILIFGVICLAIVFLIDLIKYANVLFNAYIIKYLPSISAYLNYGDLLIKLVLVPLIGICFIAAIISLWKPKEA